MSFSLSVCLKRKKHRKGKLEIVNNSVRVGNKRSAQDERGIFLRINDLPVEHLKPSQYQHVPGKHFEVFNAVAKF